MVHWMLWIFPFSRRLKIDSYQSDMRGLLNTSPIWSGIGGFLWRLLSLLPISWMSLILLNMHIFYWIFVPIMFLSLQDVMKCTLLYFSVRCWLEIASKTCWTGVGSFMQILKIQKLVLFLAWNAWFRGVLFIYWEKYVMLWYS